jgi:hypothetical protein
MKTFIDNSTGYEYVWMPKNPNAKKNGCVLLHRYLMSEKLRRPLRSDEFVHHKDGNKRNNSLDNLMLTTLPEHNQLHTRRIEIHPCEICGNNTKNIKYCSKKCSAISQRRIARPTREELIKLTQKYPMTKIGKMFGVSDNAIRKWLK